MSLLEIKDLNIRLAGASIVHDVSLAIDRGERLGLVGESGSGKTMIANAIMRLAPLGAELEGSIRLDDRELLKLDEVAMTRIRGKQIAMVFQEPMTALNPLHTVGRQIAEAVRQTKPEQRHIKPAVSAHLERVGLKADHASRYPHELSGGQRQRVVIAIAIAMEPKLLIADEPTTALDVTSQLQLLDLLHELLEESSMALLLISHDLTVVGRLVDRIAILKQGKLVEQGKVGEIMLSPSHPYTKQLFSERRAKVDLQPVVAGQKLMTIKDLTCRYRTGAGFWGKKHTVTAVKDLALDLHRGERVGLVGPSGCGKSTLARAIVGLEPADGTIHLDGQQIEGKRPMPHPVRRRMQMVFQDPWGSFNPRRKVGTLVSEPLYLLADPPVGALSEILEAVGLSAAMASRYIHEFSGGQRQRLALARALIIRPDLLVLDEPVSSLDASLRGRILDLLVTLSERLNLTTLFISHDLEDVRAITDRVLVMDQGSIVEQGPTEQIFTMPQSSHTKALLEAARALEARP